jgi:hypothetical protein
MFAEGFCQRNFWPRGQDRSAGGWASVKNGKLLRLIADSGKFEAFLTVDKSLPRQQKIQNLPFAVVVLLAKSNRLDDLVPFAPELLRRLPSFQPGRVYILSLPAAITP